jgi:hypothetical protein
MLVRMPKFKCKTIKFTIDPNRILLMTDTNNQNSGDSKADAIAAIATVLIVLTAVVYWVSSY